MTSAPFPAYPGSAAADAAIIRFGGLGPRRLSAFWPAAALMFPVFMAEFGMNYSQVGLLMSTFFVVSGLGQASAGFVNDGQGGRAAHVVWPWACL
ncbi:MAG: hypothetical protein IPN53_22885 [Comamonadaceae bacterium]|nr:hypothetical protein [Comamonadaceae bacterium]